MFSPWSIRSAYRTQAQLVLVVLVGLAAAHTVDAQQPQKGSLGPTARVGTFDSRALAIAYYRSAVFRLHTDGLKAEWEKAKAEKDEKRRRELEAESYNPTWPDSGWPPSQAQQELMHRQAMSTWPVDNILGKMQGSLLEIAREAEVEVIVSKWDLAYRRPEIEFVDVTDLMVRQFDPDGETLEIVKHVQAREPVPLEKLAHDDD